MPIVPSDGGGSTPQICAVSPSDQSGQIDNILSRLDALENAISQLATTNVTADQLSDISQNIGWVYNVTYMGIEGWTQTAAGTLIPPAGVSLSSLGILPDNNTLVSYDENGQLLIGFNQTTGAISGSSPTAWDAAAASASVATWARAKYYISWDSNSDNVTVTSTQIASSKFVSIKFTTIDAGVYFVSGHHTARKGTSDTVQTTDAALIYANAVLKYIVMHDKERDVAGQTRLGYAVSGIVEIGAGQVIEYKNNPGVDVADIQSAGASVFRIA